MNAIQIKGLHKQYGNVAALDGLDLEIPAGSVFGFLGPNGAGKTTTLRILAGLAKATSGRVEVDGREPAPFHGSAQIGYLPEEPAFFAWMTPLEYLTYVAGIFGFSDKESKKKSRELLELTGLTEASKRRIGGFSRGMRQRLGLAQALVNDPTILLLDEPVSALDPIGRKDVLEMIASLGQSRTVLMSTHILEDVERVCDTIAILDHGKRLIQSGREDLMERYAGSALEIEIGNHTRENLDEVNNKLAKLAYVDRVDRQGYVFHLAVTDLERAQEELLRTVINEKWHFTRMDVVRATLEEVFVRLVENGGGTK